MIARAWRLRSWGAIALSATLGCQGNVYIGIPIHGDAQAPPIARGYLHAVGSKLYDADGREVHLKGVSWAGMETGTRVPDGLHLRTLESLVTQVAGLGLNLLRIPYSNASLLPDSFPANTAFGMSSVAADKDLIGLSSLEVLDRIVDSAAAHGLFVILDRYRFQADASLPPAKWYSGADPDSPVGGYPQSRWISDWVALATRYASRTNVVGFDLHEEPQRPSGWGEGGPSADWKAAAEMAGNAILAVNPKLLIIVEGVDFASNMPYWPGGNLSAAGALPVQLAHPEQLVYSSHDYGKSVSFEQPWFSDLTYPDNLTALWENNWGYLVTQDLNPVLVGAFGDRGTAAGVPPDLVAADKLWRQKLVDYIHTKNLSFAFWSLNPSAEGKTGLLLPDWQSPDNEWASLLQLAATP
jgi:endoglucanase